jgi:hypothetical protein
MLSDSGTPDQPRTPRDEALGLALAAQRNRWSRGEDLPSLALWLGLPADTPLQCLGVGFVWHGRSALFGIADTPVVRMFWKPRRAIYVEIRDHPTYGELGIVGGVHLRTTDGDREWGDTLLRTWLHGWRRRPTEPPPPVHRGPIAAHEIPDHDHHALVERALELKAMTGKTWEAIAERLHAPGDTPQKQARNLRRWRKDYMRLRAREGK